MIIWVGLFVYLYADTAQYLFQLFLNSDDKISPMCECWTFKPKDSAGGIGSQDAKS